MNNEYFQSENLISTIKYVMKGVHIKAAVITSVLTRFGVASCFSPYLTIILWAHSTWVQWISKGRKD